MCLIRRNAQTKWFKLFVNIPFSRDENPTTSLQIFYQPPFILYSQPYCPCIVMRFERIEPKDEVGLSFFHARFL